MAGEKEKLIDEIFGMVTDTLSGKTVDSDKLQILARQLEEATGSKISTY